MNQAGLTMKQFQRLTKVLAAAIYMDRGEIVADETWYRTQHLLDERNM